jgi:hypothetical protein
MGKMGKVFIDRQKFLAQQTTNNVKKHKNEMKIFNQICIKLGS